MNEPVNNYRSVNLGIEEVKTEVETYYHPVSRRISTDHLANDSVSFQESDKKTLNQIQLPTIQSARINQTMPLSERLHLEVEKLIEQQITKGKIQVLLSQSPIKLQIKHRKQEKSPDSEKQLKLKLKQIQDKRQETIMMLKTIEDQEIQIKRKSVSFKFNQQSLSRSRIKKERSHFSPQEKREVKKALNKKIMLQENLNQKTINFKKRHLMEVQTERQRHQTEIEKEKSLHRSFIEEKKPIIQEKKLQRFKSIESGKKKYQQVKNKRYFYQTIEENDQKLALEELEELNRKLQTIKTKMRVTIVEELRQHKEKYNEIIKSRTQGNSIKKNISTNENSNSQVKKYEQNYFTRLARQERQQKRKDEQMAKSKLFELKKKAKQFSEHCNAEIRPKIKITSKSKFVPAESTKSTFALNYKEHLQKGNEYLTVAKKLKKCETLQDQKVLSNKGLQSIERKPYKSTYKNYLTEMRRMSESNPEDNERKKFSNFLEKQGTITEYRSLQKAFVKAESIQAISKKSNNQKLIDAVQNKIELLKMIM